MTRLIVTIAVILSLIVPALADDAPEALVDRWYAGLAKADRTTFDDLLADDAKVILEDIDAIQTKEEFLGSLDEWKNAVGSATIRHRISSVGNDTITVFVCYQFPANTTYTREIFSFRGGKIIESAQSSVGEACEGF
ncbi:nuclear transport factor 2 family protein [Phyllobacterium lublinensis]|uniref:nuclear transport factor 2 family protein n=1 Tax=Phyllobacterium lublinensis TaxID=2875708 RepID=UPI001CCE71CC|nr:nuclear transport factor 2 family protein [Phyllobacterium sp. 2063]MBZ9656575.1 nuclear transport factor 2 family protein [Phyllobacterium sp. 2063]